MLIECKLKRKGGTRIDFPEASYHFAPRPELPDAPHLAEVKHDAHVDRLLSIPEAYREYNGRIKPAPAPKRPTATADVTAEPEPASSNVEEIRALSVRDLKAKIATYSNEDLIAALAAEKAQTEDKPRDSWCEVVTAYLGDAA